MSHSEDLVLSIPMIAWPDELKFVDEDIRKEFEGKKFYYGTPTKLQAIRTQMELIVVMKDFIQALKDVNEKTKVS